MTYGASDFWWTLELHNKEIYGGDRGTHRVAINSTTQWADVLAIVMHWVAVTSCDASTPGAETSFFDGKMIADEESWRAMNDALRAQYIGTHGHTLGGMPQTFVLGTLSAFCRHPLPMT
ncbi:hypothetical protein FA95DRAFT_1604738 [Auriscalpium vulgare]|uniref:Uncharacterized protein n=1 Tax=Auriscalpium vulgare TaxID=40419 RepID=A0ACB8RYX9_9AGAM|nr:hypothetical protein FA95DRAFT_1604738 [Auriscalpium vulgare]